MSFNLIDTIKGSLSNELISKAASHLGESESGISKAFSGAIPSVLLSLLNKSSNSNTSSHGILDMAKTAASSGILSNLTGLFGGSNSAHSQPGGILSFASSLFGDKFSSITSLISNFAGIKDSSAASILSMAAPTALASIGNHAQQNNLDASGIASLLSNQKQSILSAIPSGFNLTSLGGLLGFSGLGSKVTQSATSAVNKQINEVKGGTPKWILPLLAALLIGAAILFLTKNGCNKTATTETVIIDSPKTTTTTTPSTNSINVTLPNGITLNALKGGIEDKLVSFLSTDYKALGADSLKKLWFDFDNLTFKTGSAELTTESMKQLENMVAILKAFPSVKVKIGGYTDKTGNEDSNVKLSASRANTVKTELVKAGVGTQVTDAEGYGSKFANYAADAPETDRVKDRHVSVNVKG